MRNESDPFGSRSSRHVGDHEFGIGESFMGFGTKTVLMIGVLGFLSGRPAFLDIAVVYALMNFISIIAVLRYSNFDDLHLDVQPEKEAE